MMDDSFMHRWAWFANILLSIIASAFRRETSLQLSFLTVSLSSVNIKVVVASYNETDGRESLCFYWEGFGYD